MKALIAAMIGTLIAGSTEAVARGASRMARNRGAG